MHRHPAHRNVVTIAFATLGQGDPERRCAYFGIFKKHLVKVTHTIEQQRIRM